MANFELAKIQNNNNKRVKLYIESILFFQKLLVKFPNFINADKAIYAIAQALEFLQYKKDSVIFYKQIVSKYCNSKYVINSKNNVIYLYDNYL
jgi:hypothetical protein